MRLCFVIPVFDEQDTLRALTEGIVANVGDHEYRIVFIDDGSTDDSWKIMQSLRQEYPQIDIIRLRRNFGKSQALSVGFHQVYGDIIFMMDADLQDDPKEIPRFLDKMAEGYDVVCGWKKHRLDPWHKTFPSRIYNRIIARLFKLELHDINTGFKAFRGEIVRKLPLYGEMHRLVAVFADNLGYKVTEIPVSHKPRLHGRSKFGVERFTRGATDVLTAWFLRRYGEKPAHLFATTAFFLGLLGALGMLMVLAMTGYTLLLQEGMTPEIRMAYLTLTLVLLSICLMLIFFGFVGMGVGLISQLFIHRLPIMNPTDFIQEENCGHPDEPEVLENP